MVGGAMGSAGPRGRGRPRGGSADCSSVFRGPVEGLSSGRSIFYVEKLSVCCIEKSFVLFIRFL